MYFQAVRVAGIPPFGEYIAELFEPFRDQQDRGSLILTPIYLLLACSGPIWIMDSKVDTSDGDYSPAYHPTRNSRSYKSNYRLARIFFSDPFGRNIHKFTSYNSNYRVTRIFWSVHLASSYAEFTVEIFFQDRLHVNKSIHFRVPFLPVSHSQDFNRLTLKHEKVIRIIYK